MNRFLALSLATVASATLFVGTGVFAQAAPTPAPTELTRAAAETRANEMFAQLDANSDGQLNAADREAALRARFDEADTDNNGQLSFAEASAAHAARAEHREDRRADRGGRMGRMGMMRHGGPDGPGMGARMLERGDTDNNGSVSKAEFTAAALARFDRADANDDGTISAGEHRGGRGEGRRGRR